ncbi:uncharacterized protein MCYG_07498 [Microsporum canis CBS 113480]|uniref:Uncharacterized protein n=1 Tax=Arthroderma otae (strain ATCC MYA-4605 / CBS 113480) TaxID=554155 RepID=C5FYT1_ARTOC|nr:uncharacterized protein MCYG_07498 [Microsporum canis CBS 113480]EEQ34679.1 predicted protein [Microsporum canis CBS 113480]
MPASDINCSFSGGGSACAASHPVKSQESREPGESKSPRGRVSELKPSVVFHQISSTASIPRRDKTQEKKKRRRWRKPKPGRAQSQAGCHEPGISFCCFVRRSRECLWVLHWKSVIPP